MNTTTEWGAGWAILAYGVTWAVFLGYVAYVNGRVTNARAALRREAERMQAATQRGGAQGR